MEERGMKLKLTAKGKLRGLKNLGPNYNYRIIINKGIYGVGYQRINGKFKQEIITD